MTETTFAGRHPHGDADPAPFAEDTVRALDALAVEQQREGRVPGHAAAVGRRGTLAWFAGIGAADLESGEEPTSDTSYPVASNSKTVTAVAVMALRDEGRLDLDDTIDEHLTGSPHERVTIRQLLSHTSGMQREPVGDVWDTMLMPSREELVAGWSQAERVGRPHHVWHYSNLAFSVLGELVAQIEGCSWFEAVERRILLPLEMTRTTLGPSGRRARGYYVPPFSDVPLPEPDLAANALDAAAGLASTPADMARWGGFVADPVDEVLHPDTLEEMCAVQTLVDPHGWTLGMGLGFMLARHEGHTWVGHTGGWPGSVTGVFTERDSATTGVVMMNSSSPIAPSTAAIALGTLALEREPVPAAPWVPGTAVPDELVGVLGHWYSEGTGFVFSVREGQLEARVVDAAKGTPPAVFERVGEDRYRTVSGRERGELLRVTRGDDGGVVRMHWATYAFTREPLAFGGRR